MKRLWIALVLLLPMVVAGWLRLRFETDILATLPCITAANGCGAE